MNRIDKKNQRSGKFLSIMVMCFLVYLACYATKNLLSVNSPLMIEEGFNSTIIGAMSSVYFLCYGIGQLFTGFIGDKIKLKYMLLSGLVLASLSCFAFILFESIILKSVVWGTCGFGLSLIYAPLVKSISEHLEGKQIEICMTLLNFAAIFGSTVAGMLGILGNWKLATCIFAVILAVLAISSFIFNLIFDKRFPLTQSVKVATVKAIPLKKFTGYWLKHGAVAFIFISAIQGIAKNSITFWTPTYISQYLGFTPKLTAVIFSVLTFVSAANQVIAILLYHLMKNKAIWVIRLSFTVSTIGFLLLLFISNVYANLVVLLISTSGYNWAGTMIWTYYCCRFKNVGRVAFVVGSLNFISYFFAAVSSLIFSNAISAIGWTYLIIIWSAIMFVGILVTLFYRVKESV